MSGNLTSITQIRQRRAQGRGPECSLVLTNQSIGGLTLADANSGRITMNAQWVLTSTLMSALNDVKLPAGSANLRLVEALITSLGAGGLPFALARLYLFGTVSLSSTGNQFTHDAATFPVLRTVQGVASTAIDLTPIIIITTATATTQAVMKLATATGGNGYVNQDGSKVVGTRTITLPAAAVNPNSGYMFNLEDTDTGVQDILQVDVTTAASAGAASIYGAEWLGWFNAPATNQVQVDNHLSGGLDLRDLRPAVATSGTVTSNLVLMTPLNNTNISFDTSLNMVAD